MKYFITCYEDKYVHNSVPGTMMNKNTGLKTSSEWQILTGVKVIKPGGWDTASFYWSWFEEPITFEEFKRRLSNSEWDVYNGH